MTASPSALRHDVGSMTNAEVYKNCLVLIAEFHVYLLISYHPFILLPLSIHFFLNYYVFNMRPFEEFLPSNTPIYEFRSIEQTVQIIEQEMSRLGGSQPRLGDPLNPFLIFLIDRRSFLLWQDSGESLLQHSAKLYDYASSQLLVEMRSAQHEHASAAFSAILQRWYILKVKNPRGRLIPCGGTSVEGETRKRDPDVSWRASLASGTFRWPTFVVEVAWSEPRRKLIEDITFWLTEPASLVSIALTITVSEEKNENQPSTKTVVIEKWETHNDKDTSNRVRPSQQVKIVKAPGVGPQITGSIQLPLEAIFYRPKDEDEEDFIIESEKMKEIVDMIWPSDLPGE